MSVSHLAPDTIPCADAGVIISQKIRETTIPPPSFQNDPLPLLL